MKKYLQNTTKEKSENQKNRKKKFFCEVTYAPTFGQLGGGGCFSGKIIYLKVCYFK